MPRLPLLAVAAALVVSMMVPANPGRSAGATAFDYEFEAIEGGALPLAKWRGQVLLVVNTVVLRLHAPI